MFIPSWRATLDWLKGIIAHWTILLKSGWCFNCIITKPCWKKQNYCSFHNIIHHGTFCWRVPISCKVIASHDFLERFPRKGKPAKCCWNYKFSLFLCWQYSPETSFSKEFGITHKKAFWTMLEDSSIFTFPCLPCCHCRDLVALNILLLQTLEVKKGKKIPKSHVGTKKRPQRKPTWTPRHCMLSFMAEILAEFHVLMEVVARVGTNSWVSRLSEQMLKTKWHLNHHKNIFTISSHCWVWVTKPGHLNKVRQAFLKYPSSHSIPDWELMFLVFGAFFNNTSLHISISLLTDTWNVGSFVTQLRRKNRGTHITFFS